MAMDEQETEVPAENEVQTPPSSDAGPLVTQSELDTVSVMPGGAWGEFPW